MLAQLTVRALQENQKRRAAGAPQHKSERCGNTKPAGQQGGRLFRAQASTARWSCPAMRLQSAAAQLARDDTVRCLLRMRGLI